MLRRSFVFVASAGLLAAGLLTASACSSSSTSGSSASSQSSTPATATPGQFNLELGDMPTGTAVLHWDPATKVITAAINMTGFTPNSAHAMHIHPGTCADQSQPPAVPFPDIAADAQGDVHQSVVSQPVPEGIPSAAYLNIHLAPSAQLGSENDVGHTPIACGDIGKGTSPSGPVTLKVVQPPKNGVVAAGTASLAYGSADHKLRVDVKASGLDPNSVHAVHIHKGSCAAQGDVLYPLPDLKADGSGNASLTATVDNAATAPPATGWYLNVHRGPMSQILNDNAPTLLFAPILCADVTG